MDDDFYYLPGSSDADPEASDEAPQCQMSTVLQSLKDSKLISSQCLRSGLQLVEAVSKNPDLSGHLSSFLIDLEQSLKTQNQKTESGGWPWSVSLNSPKAKVFTTVSGETFNAHKYIKNKLKSKVNVVTNLRECDVIVLFCPISSRIGSDVEAALKNIPESGKGKPVILVLMHHTRNIYHSAGDSDWSDEHSAVVSHVNVLFHETQRGLLTCSKNDEAIQNLLDQCMQHAK